MFIVVMPQRDNSSGLVMPQGDNSSGLVILVPIQSYFFIDNMLRIHCTSTVYLVGYTFKIASIFSLSMVQSETRP